MQWIVCSLDLHLGQRSLHRVQSPYDVDIEEPPRCRWGMRLQLRHLEIPTESFSETASLPILLHVALRLQLIEIDFAGIDMSVFNPSPSTR